ncbi:MAG TPA: PilN domain-containing protein [Solirubrobacterales bacterium]|nr:PilN domain-containing protein [Solirubrobacterales bacterium]
MRPVNLIPKEDRPGGRRPMRGGPLAYIVVGALVAALIAVTALVATGNQIGDLEGEIAQIEGEVSGAEAKATALAPYTQFHTVSQQRIATVTGLADSRFDWERVMRELALVLPGDVWLTNLTATANPGVIPDGAATVSLRSSIRGPALSLIGCASSQDAVAGFVQALKDMDGVTRVGVQSSNVGSSTAGSDSAGAASCQTRDFIAQFQMVAAFDAAPVTSTATTGELALAPAPAPAPEAEAAPEEEG